MSPRWGLGIVFWLQSRIMPPCWGWESFFDYDLGLWHPVGVTIMSPLRGFGIVFHYNPSIMPPRWGLGIIFWLQSRIMPPCWGLGWVFKIFSIIFSPLRAFYRITYLIPKGWNDARWNDFRDDCRYQRIQSRRDEMILDEIIGMIPSKPWKGGRMVI